MIAANPTKIFEMLIDRSAFLVLLLKINIKRKKRDMSAYTPEEFNCLKTLAEIFIISLDKTNSFKTILTIFFSFGLLLQRIQKLFVHSIVHLKYILPSAV